MGAIAQTKRLRPLREWLDQSYFLVTAATKKSYHLEVDVQDFAGALFDDADRLLNHSTEHQFEVYNRFSIDGWTSVAWLVVTCYYWAFFFVQAFSRLTARSLVWFLNGQASARLTGMSLSGSKLNPGAGSYVITATTPATVSRREIALTKTSGRLHDAVWRHFFKYWESVLPFTDSVNSPLEYRLISALTRSATELGADWPSRLRNTVNYQAGLCYRLMDSSGPSILPRRQVYRGRYPVEEVIDRMENALGRLGGEKDILVGLASYGELLVYCSYLIFALADDLFSDIFQRHNSRRASRIAKSSFRSSVGIVDPQTGMMWPFAK